jgi:hypothetical protein
MYYIEARALRMCVDSTVHCLVIKRLYIFERRQLARLLDIKNSHA